MGQQAPTAAELAHEARGLLFVEALLEVLSSLPGTSLACSSFQRVAVDRQLSRTGLHVAFLQEASCLARLVA